MTAWPRARRWSAKSHVVDGVRFGSGEELARYRELHVLQRAGDVVRFTCHPSWEFVINGVRVGRFTADFEVVYPSGEVVIEDVKPSNGAPPSRDYVLRKKLLLALYGIPVTEVRMRSGRRQVA